jgi:hypothetical protein
MVAGFILPTWALIFMGGSMGLPLSIPPLPEDPAMARVAPAECLWYMSAAGMAQADLQSSNQTEQLLAEPEIQRLAFEIERQLVRIARRNASSARERTLATELPPLVKMLLTRPMAAYVADFAIGDRGPRVQGGLVVHAGPDAERMERSLQEIAAVVTGAAENGSPALQPDSEGIYTLPTPPEAPGIRWTRRQQYLVVGIGEGEVERIVGRLDDANQQPPAWLANIQNELPIERRATLGYVNVARILERIQPMLGERAAIVQQLGLDGVQAIYSTTGLNDVAAVSKGRIALEGEPRGLLSLLPAEPLNAEDLGPIPADASVAVAVRLDLAETLDRLTGLMARIDPRARDQFEQHLWQMEGELGIDLRTDILGLLGDTWMVYMPPGSAISSWTGVIAAVKVSDESRLEQVIDQLVDRARVEFARQSGNAQDIRVHDSPLGDDRLYYVQAAGLPISPSWAVVDGYLLVGLMPQSIKAAANRLADDQPSLAQSEMLASVFQDDSPPSVFSYVDAQSLFRAVYPLVTLGINTAASRMASEGFEWDMALLPSVETIASHLVPSTASWRRTSDGFAFESHRTLPGGDLIASAPMTIALVLPAVSQARGAAEVVQDINRMRQLALAFHNYAAVHAKFPTNVYDQEGNALLSWRVRLLPYLEAAALYEQFHLDEPWDSPHNRTLIGQMPDTLRSATVPTEWGHTPFLAFAAEGTLFPGEDEISFASVTDGTSNTLMFVLAAADRAVPWTQPQDIEFDPDNPKQGLADRLGRFLAAFADGHVDNIASSLSDESMRRLVLRADGQVIDPTDLGRPRAEGVRVPELRQAPVDAPIPVR